MTEKKCIQRLYFISYRLTFFKEIRMKLYHYSKEKFDVLKTKAIQNGLSIKEIEEENKKANTHYKPGAYNNHISFFFDRIPFTIIGDLFKNKNHTWYNGNKLNEYVVESSSLDIDIRYHVVESPTFINEMDKIDDSKWEDEHFKYEFLKRMYLLQSSIGEIGNNKHDLEKEINKFKNKTQHYYEAASKRNDFDFNIHKYAASVPHLMLYPKTGIIKISSISEIVIGQNKLNDLHFTKW